MKLKRMGVKPGWPDFLFISPHGTLYMMEVKSTEGRLTQEQKTLMEKCIERGVEFAVVRSCDDAADLITAWKDKETSGN
jgi:hypothetical protein